MVTRSSSTGAPCRSWYRRKPPVTAAMNPSLTLPPAADAARFSSANRISNVSRWRAWLRPFMIGERVSRSGASVRQTTPSSSLSAARSSGRGIARNAAGTAERGPRRHDPERPDELANDALADQSRQCPVAHNERTVDLRYGRRRWRPRRRAARASCMPPSPSVSEWCSFMTNAARPPWRCSTRVNSQRGCDGSKPVIATIRATSITVSGV